MGKSSFNWLISFPLPCLILRGLGESRPARRLTRQLLKHNFFFKATLLGSLHSEIAKRSPQIWHGNFKNGHDLGTFSSKSNFWGSMVDLGLFRWCMLSCSSPSHGGKVWGVWVQASKSATNQSWGLELIKWLVVRTPLKNHSQLGWLFPVHGKMINVPKHQLD